MNKEDISKDDNFYTSQVFRGVNCYNSILNSIPNTSRYDVMISHEVYCSGLAGALFASENNIPYSILDIVEYPVFSQRISKKIRNEGNKCTVSDYLLSKMAVSISELYNSCFSSSQGQLDYYKEESKKNISIDTLYNYRSLSDSSHSHFNVREYFELDKNDILIAFPNRVYADSGVFIFLEVLLTLDDKFKLVIIGDVVNEIKNDFYTFINEKNLINRVFVTGMLDPSCVIPALSGCDLALVLLEPIIDNNKYSLPNRLFDSIFSCLPVVCFKDTEVGKFVDDNNLGISIEYDGNEINNRLINAIIACLKDKEFYNSHLSRFNLVNNWECESKKLQSVILNKVPFASKALIIANKNIERNDRICRISKALTSLNIEVDVFCKKNPVKNLTVSGVNYITE